MSRHTRRPPNRRGRRATAILVPLAVAAVVLTGSAASAEQSATSTIALAAATSTATPTAAATRTHRLAHRSARWLAHHTHVKRTRTPNPTTSKTPTSTASGPSTATPSSTATSGNALGGQLVLAIAGSDPGVNQDRVEVAGSARLAGSLVINFATGYTPAAGTRFAVLHAGGGVSGAFSTVTNNRGLRLVLSQDATTVSVSVAR